MPDVVLLLDDVPRLVLPPICTYEVDGVLGTLPPAPILAPRLEVGLGCLAASSALLFSSSSARLAAISFLSCSSASCRSAARCFSRASSSMSAIS